ncbi:hypothetical protein AVEN_252759-1 [Araneus ventricosus]|uniref:2Fe-2S ferredoxin-type domain-containing protein n=1 Tax=Araneus ventricosus TaxID=182803 RepID=A0A4Y2U0M0_ARAVE|nr:hypothetical protein AVEN_252759-1 [Araneus ventricosus]
MSLPVEKYKRQALKPKRVSWNLTCKQAGVCFGTSFCRTCHVYFKPEDFNKIPKLHEDSDEAFYLEEIPNYKAGSSRLGCHISLQKVMKNMEICRPKKCLGSKIVPP